LQVIDALQRGEGTLGGIFCPQTLEMFWPTLQVATTSRITDKWMLRLDSTNKFSEFE
jgi:hypothetical protein